MSNAETWKPNLDIVREPEKGRIAWVVDRFNALEDNLTSILATYVSPPAERSSFFRSYVCSNAILPFSNKVKLLRQICTESTIPVSNTEWSHFHKVMALRNAYLHSSTGEVIEIVLDDDYNSVSGSGGRYSVIEQMSGSGKLEVIETDAAFSDFVQEYGHCREIVSKISKGLQG